MFAGVGTFSWPVGDRNANAGTVSGIGPALEKKCTRAATGHVTFPDKRGRGISNTLW